MALAGAGYALFLRLGADWTYFDMLPTLLLVGVAFALAFGTLMIVATDGIDEHEQGLAGGLQYVSLQFGAAVGLAIVAAVNVAATTGRRRRGLLDGYRTALLVPVALAALALAVTATGLTRYGLTSSRSRLGRRLDGLSPSGAPPPRALDLHLLREEVGADHEGRGGDLRADRLDRRVDAEPQARPVRQRDVDRRDRDPARALHRARRSGRPSRRARSR